ncbi:hypothetical protein D3C79_885030 [compost metagenome]
MGREQQRRLLSTLDKADGVLILPERCRLIASEIFQTEKLTIGDVCRHALDTHQQDTFSLAAQQAIAGQMESTTGRRTAIAEAENRHARVANLRQHLLGDTSFCVYAGSKHLVDQVIVDPRIGQRCTNGLPRQCRMTVRATQR